MNMSFPVCSRLRYPILTPTYLKHPFSSEALRSIHASGPAHSVLPAGEISRIGVRLTESIHQLLISNKEASSWKAKTLHSHTCTSTAQYQRSSGSNTDKSCMETTGCKTTSRLAQNPTRRMSWALSPMLSVLPPHNIYNIGFHC